jgi:hypothetical protein
MNRRSMVFSLRRNRTHSLTARVLKKTLCGTQISESIMIFTMTLSTIEAIRVHWHEYLRPCSDVTIPARPQVLFFTCCNHRWGLFAWCTTGFEFGLFEPDPYDGRTRTRLAVPSSKSQNVLRTLERPSRIDATSATRNQVSFIQILTSIRSVSMNGRLS